MSTILKNVISFSGLTVGVPVAIAHLLNVNEVAVAPQLVAGNAPGFTITASSTTVTVTRLLGAAAAVQIYVEHWHSIERVLPPSGSPPFALTGLVPFIISSGGAPPTGATANGAMFYGTTTGTGSEGNDYAATVAVQTTAGTGRVPFPRNGPTTGAPAIRDGVETGEFVVAVAGIYEVSWNVEIVEASQLQLAIDDVGVATTTSFSGAGTQLNQNTVLVTCAAGDKLSLINPPGNAAALTIQPADGTHTHAQAPNLIIKLVAAS